MNLAKISKEFDEFFEFTTEDRTQVSSVSCKLFADHCVIKAIEDYKASLAPVVDYEYKNLYRQLYALGD